MPGARGMRARGATIGTTTSARDIDGSIIVGGTARTYHVHLPPQQSAAMPLLLVLHGSGGTGVGTITLTHMNDLADQQGAHRRLSRRTEQRLGRWARRVGFRPAGRGRRRLPQPAHRDPASAIPHQPAPRLCYWHLERRLHDPAAGLRAGEQDRRHRLQSWRPFPRTRPPPARRRVPCRSSTSSARTIRWFPTMAVRCAATGEPSSPRPTRSPPGPSSTAAQARPRRGRCPDRVQDDTHVSQTLYTNCQGGAQVGLYSVAGGGHTWPSGEQYLPAALVGRTTHQIDNGDLWAFLSQFQTA